MSTRLVSSKAMGHFVMMKLTEEWVIEDLKDSVVRDSGRLFG